MKQFFEQYGGVALGILALLVLIALITPVGNIIKTSLQGTTETFSTRMESQTDTMTVQMQEAFESANTETHYDENGVLLNGIIDRTLYVDGVAYQNLWNKDSNSNININGASNKQITEKGYTFVSNHHDPWAGNVAIDYNNYKYVPSQGQKYTTNSNKEYILISRNAFKNYIMYYDANSDCLSNRHSDEFYEYAYNSYNTEVKRITLSEIPAGTEYFTFRVDNGSNATIGQTYEFEMMVFEIPSDLEIDLSSL